MGAVAPSPPPSPPPPSPPPPLPTPRRHRLGCRHRRRRRHRRRAHRRRRCRQHRRLRRLRLVRRCAGVGFTLRDPDFWVTEPPEPPTANVTITMQWHAAAAGDSSRRQRPTTTRVDVAGQRRPTATPSSLQWSTPLSSQGRLRPQRCARGGAPGQRHGRRAPRASAAAVAPRVAHRSAAVRSTPVRRAAVAAAAERTSVPPPQSPPSPPAGRRRHPWPPAPRASRALRPSRLPEGTPEGVIPHERRRHLAGVCRKCPAASVNVAANNAEAACVCRRSTSRPPVTSTALDCERRRTARPARATRRRHHPRRFAPASTGTPSPPPAVPPTTPTRSTAPSPLVARRCRLCRAPWRRLLREAPSAIRSAASTTPPRVPACHRELGAGGGPLLVGAAVVALLLWPPPAARAPHTTERLSGGDTAVDCVRSGPAPHWLPPAAVAGLHRQAALPSRRFGQRPRLQPI